MIGVPFAPSNMACELVARRPLKDGTRKVYHQRTNVLAGYIFEPDGKGAGWAYSVGPRRYASGSRDKMDKRRFKTIKAAKAALAGEL